MPGTWVYHSELVFGRYVPISENRERLVVLTLFQNWLNQGMSESQIALKWNAGNATRCSSGINRHGVAYDSCAYQQKVLAML